MGLQTKTCNILSIPETSVNPLQVNISPYKHTESNQRFISIPIN